jgi:hypothetical protein
MNIGDYLIWEATNGLLLIPTVIGLVMLVRRFRGRPVFNERDWLFLFGHSRKEVFSPRLLLRFAAMLVLVVVVGLGLSFYVLPYGLGWFVGAVVLTIAGILLVAPKWLR